MGNFDDNWSGSGLWLSYMDCSVSPVWQNWCKPEQAWAAFFFAFSISVLIFFGRPWIVILTMAFLHLSGSFLYIYENHLARLSLILMFSQASVDFHPDLNSSTNIGCSAIKFGRNICALHWTVVYCRLYQLIFQSAPSLPTSKSPLMYIICMMYFFF